VLILAVGISGIEQMGGAFYVEPLFNGSTLVIAVGMAGWAARRRLRTSRVTASAAEPAEAAATAARPAGDAVP
jgi:ribose transport system permease protein